MTKELFAQKLKTLEFKKVTSANGAKGYLVSVPRADGTEYSFSCYAAPDMKAKKAIDYAWEMILRRVAREWGYEGDITAFK